MSKSTAKQPAKSKSKAAPPRATLGAEELPRRTLEETLVLARALHETYAGKSASWDELAKAAELAATNSTKYLFWGAQAYGIINKEPTGQVFSLSETGRKIVAPTYDGEDREGVLKAVLTPTLLSKFYTDYNGHPIPGPTHLPNVLETRFGVPRERITEATQIILSNAEFARIVETDNEANAKRINISASSLPNPSPDAPPTDKNDKGPDGLAAGPSADAGDWKKVCFLITPIGSDTSDERKHADMMLKHLLIPVAEQYGLEIVRADKIEKSGLITQQIFDHLVRAKVCVADLSFNNPNVFYELGVRHVCKLSTIQIIRKGDKIPFDVSQGRTIVIDTSDVYTVMDRFESARRELSEHMKHVMADGKGDAADDNPVNVYLPGLKVVIPP